MALPKLDRDEASAPEFMLLGERGLFPDRTGKYNEQSLARVVFDILRERGLDPEVVVDASTGDWVVEVRDQRTPTEPRIAIVHDSDRSTALLRALQLSLSWLTPEEDRALFDQHAQSLLGISGAEFLKKWQSGKLSADDPAVVHLLMIRPRD